MSGGVVRKTSFGLKGLSAQPTLICWGGTGFSELSVLLPISFSALRGVLVLGEYIKTSACSEQRKSPRTS